jgi:1-aminocyclopropane-1-carboxylate deaminase
MLAIAQLANHKGVPLTYFSREINLRDSNVLGGNLQTALALGMRHVQLQTEIYQELTKTKNIIQTLGSTKCHVTRLLKSAIQSDKENNVFIPQGASFPEAELGVQTLAQEINQYCDVQKPTKFTVVLPCGTGTTAFYLAKHLNPDIRLYGVPCVGDAKYLEEQIQELATKPSFISNKILPRFPSILIPRTKSKFGRLSIPLYDLFHELKTETNIEFDLIYASFTWQTLLDQLDLLRFDDTCSPQGLLGSNTNRVLPREIIYVHTGGVSGNSTMLERYITKLRNKSFHIAPINCGPHHKDHGDI